MGGVVRPELPAEPLTESKRQLLSLNSLPHQPHRSWQECRPDNKEPKIECGRTGPSAVCRAYNGSSHKPSYSLQRLALSRNLWQVSTLAVSSALRLTNLQVPPGGGWTPMLWPCQQGRLQVGGACRHMAAKCSRRRGGRRTREGFIQCETSSTSPCTARPRPLARSIDASSADGRGRGMGRAV